MKGSHRQNPWFAWPTDGPRFMWELWWSWRILCALHLGFSWNISFWENAVAIVLTKVGNKWNVQRHQVTHYFFRIDLFPPRPVSPGPVIFVAKFRKAHTLHSYIAKPRLCIRGCRKGQGQLWFNYPGVLSVQDAYGVTVKFSNSLFWTPCFFWCFFCAWKFKVLFFWVSRPWCLMGLRQHGPGWCAQIGDAGNEGQQQWHSWFLATGAGWVNVEFCKILRITHGQYTKRKYPHGTCPRVKW